HTHSPFGLSASILLIRLLLRKCRRLGREFSLTPLPSMGCNVYPSWPLGPPNGQEAGDSGETAGTRVRVRPALANFYPCFIRGTLSAALPRQFPIARTPLPLWASLLKTIFINPSPIFLLPAYTIRAS